MQSASEIQRQGIEIECKVITKDDLSRQVVKAASASVYIKEIDLQIPPSQSQNNSVLTTLEGLIDRIIEDLSEQQENRKLETPELYAQLEIVINKLKEYMNNDHEFTITIRDIAGNSFVENLMAPSPDPQMKVTHFHRTAQDNEFLGLAEEVEVEETNEQIVNKLKEEVHEFPSNCSQCKSPCPTRMKLINIPHFREVVIMSSVCDSCGYKSNEVKAAGAMSAKGKKIELKLTCEDDLSRDILKSETSGLTIPEIELELSSGTLGGKFTTIEGLLDEIKVELSDKTPFRQGDGAEGNRKELFGKFLQKLDDLGKMTHDWTIILDDPMGNSYIQNLYAPDPDPNMKTSEYERTEEQNDFFGISDMKV